MKKRITRQLSWLLFALLAFSGASFAPYGVVKGPIHTIIIDPGHGGRDPGAVGDEFYEKEITLKVGLALKKLVEKRMPEVKVVMTREKDRFVALHRRASKAQDAGGSVFISIHCNGLSNKETHGAESYVLGTNKGQENYDRVIAENESILFEDNHQEVYGGFDPRTPEGYIYFRLLKDVFRQESTRLAQKIQKQYSRRFGRRDRGVKQAPFVVLYLSGMPAVLTEIGFITNPEEEKFMSSEIGQQYIATCIYRAIRNYNMEF